MMGKLLLSSNSLEPKAEGQERLKKIMIGYYNGFSCIGRRLILNITTDWTVEEAMRFIVTGGTVAPDIVHYSRSEAKDRSRQDCH